MSEGRSVRHGDAGSADVGHADAEDVRGPRWEEAVAAGAARGPLVPADDQTADDADPPADGNLARYLRWQARDWVRTRGVWIFAAVLAVLVIAWLSYDPALAQRVYRQQLAGLQSLRGPTTEVLLTTPRAAPTTGAWSRIQTDAAMR